MICQSSPKYHVLTFTLTSALDQAGIPTQSVAIFPFWQPSCGQSLIKLVAKKMWVWGRC